MKICILSTGRAGSTSLYNAFISHLGNEYYSITEPFNIEIKRTRKVENNQFEYINNCEKICIKTLVNQIPSNMEKDVYYEWLFNFFDYVILLDRRNKILQTESFAFHRYTNDENWHLIQKRYNINIIPSDFIDNIHNEVIMFEDILKKLSIKYKHKIYYYEDIFIDNDKKLIEEIFSNITSNIDEDIIHRLIISDKMKVRIDDIKTKLL
jgi:hypothetical protein